MTFDIVEAVEAKLTPDEVTRIAESIGESPATTRQATSNGVLAIVDGLLHRSKTETGAASVLAALSSLQAGVPNLVSSLLGDQEERVESSIASSSGVSRSAASRILTALMPLVSAVIGHEVVSRGLDARGLSEMLLSQKRLPFAGRGVATIERQPDVPLRATTRSSRSAALLPLLAIGALLLGGLLLLFLRKPMLPKTTSMTAPIEEPRSQTTLTSAEIPKSSLADIDEHFGREATLPDRVMLPGVTFDSRTAQMTSEGNDAVEHLAAAMKAHPTSEVRLEGHTDDSEEKDLTPRLSYERAATVRQMLIDRGVDGRRITIGGIRDLGPIAMSDTEQGRAFNRRVDAVIISR